MVGSGDVEHGSSDFWQRHSIDRRLDRGRSGYVFRNNKRMNMSFSPIQKGERWAYIRWRIAQVWRRIQGRS